MGTHSADTTADAAQFQTAVLRRLGVEGRARMTFELSDNLRAVTEAGIRHRHPEYDDRRVRLELIRIVLGPELFTRWYSGQRP
jgi:hypothetical protein